MATAPTARTDPAQESRRVRGLAAALMAVAALVYANSLEAPFIFDDFQAVANNPTILDLRDPAAVLNPPLDAAGSTGRPLVNLSFALNYAAGGLDVRGYHAGSILLHALGALVLFGLLRRIFLLPSLAARRGSGATGRAFAIALLWAVHPLLTESVVCIAQRNEVLGGLCYLLTLYAFVRSAGAGANAPRWQAASVAACLAGLASKEIVATAPLLVLLLDRTFVAGTFAAAWRQRKKYYTALAATWLVLAWLMARADQRGGIVGFGLGMSSWDYLVTQCRALVLYLKLSLWPHPLVVDYGHAVFPLAAVWREGLAIVALGLATVWALWRRPAWGFAGACFFVILAPSSSFVPLTTQTIAEHRMYLPLAVIVTGVVLALEAAWPRRWRMAVGCLAVAAAVLTIRRNAEYLDEPGLWQATLEHQPRNDRIYAHLGDYYRRHDEWEAAATAFRRATELRDTFSLAYSELGSMLLELGRVDESLAQHRRALELRPDDATIQYNYGVACARAGNIAAAVQAWEQALRLRPGLAPALKRLSELDVQKGDFASALARYEEAARSARPTAELLDGWGRTLTEAGKYPEAVERLEAARRLRPDVAEVHYNLGNARLHLGQVREAGELYREALRLKPDLWLARHNLALSLMQLDNLPEAIVLLETVVREQPESVEFRLNLSLALAQAGRRPAALAQAREALRLAPGNARARELVRQLEAGPP